MKSIPHAPTERIAKPQLSKVAEAVSQMRLEGNIHPTSWFHEPRLKFPGGKTNLAAIVILADVMGWYRILEIRDERTGKTIERRQLFEADKLQKNYSDYAAELGLTKRTLQDALKFLARQNFITLEYRTVDTRFGRLPNIVFIEPVVEEVAKITHPARQTREGLPLKRKTPRVPTENVSRANGEAPMPKRETLQKRPENSKNDSSLRASDEDENFSELISALCAQGVPEGQARSAATTHAVELRRRLSFLPFVEVRKSPGAFLMARLDTEYHEPPGAAKKREAAARSVQASRTKANADETRRAEEAAQQRVQQESAALDAIFSSMPPQTQRVIVEDAKRAAPQLAPFGKWTPTAEQIAVREELRRRAAGASADLT